MMIQRWGGRVAVIGRGEPLTSPNVVCKIFLPEDEMETELMHDTETDTDFGLDKDGGNLYLG